MLPEACEDHGVPGTRDGARQRKVIHIDMDAFYASVEQRDHPELRGRPIAVGGSRERGVVAAASYESRRFGVHSAMPSVTAKRLCPELIFVKPRFDVYREVSLQIREIFLDYTPLMEPLSLDEAYLDVTENLKGIEYASRIAKEIRKRIWEETHLTASGGIGPNKFLSKMASDINKPNGQYVITPEMAQDFVAGLRVGKFHGIGDKTERRMNRLGIFTGLDLRSKPADFLQQHFGKAGQHYYWIARGVDERPVQPDRIRKSIGAENTFASDLTDMDELRACLDPIIEKVWSHCERTGVRGRSVTLKVKYADFQQITRSQSTPREVGSREDLGAMTKALLEGTFPLPKAVRLLGVTLSNLQNDRDDPPLSSERQLSLGL
ncbi:DNA polymerase IV [Bosea rubneri]|uniref:DNA polymerase IV n=1 Tax=Bosea rubneri TaxID=3075434 RepID=A0ABU3SCJ0_9HYPH|nr:DNA polymerase IV [Bosea sp. ZW T0_25]MDU0342075.1 DNA polymerase IV [Bosea sp. ZW T0_25]